MSGEICSHTASSGRCVLPARNTEQAVSLEQRSRVDAAPNFTADAQPVLRDYLGAIADQEGGPRGEVWNWLLHRGSEI